MAGRPRSFDRQKALDIAVEQFWRNGYEDTTVASLTREMGIAAPSLYAAFGDKDQLFAEAVECYSGINLIQIDAALALPEVHAAIGELMRGYAAAHTDPETPLGCLVLTEPRLGDKREILRKRIERRLARGAAEGDLPPETNSADLAGFLVATLAGMSVRARDGASAEEVNAIAALALAALPAG